MEKTTGKNPPVSSVELTHPDRVYWPDEGVTKRDLANYHAQVWEFMAPFVVNRPLALLRCPDGIGGQRFFQKHAWKGINPHIGQIRDPQDDGEDALLAIEDFDGMAALVQSAVLELHPWGATVKEWEKPDMVIMDLDPGDDVAWPDVIAAAREIGERFKAAGLAAFVKTSGGKGLHVVAPLKPKAGWADVKAFARALASQMAADAPERYVATAAKSERAGRTYIDYLRNGRGSTAVAPYSPRARPGAPVSMPIGWTELDGRIGPASFHIKGVTDHLIARGKDPWADFFEAAEPLAV